MAYKANSGSFTKGDPRINRSGRKKVGDTLAAKIRDALDEKLSEDYSNLDSIIDAAVKKALKGDLTAFEILAARGYGKVPDRIDLTQRKEFDLSKLTDEELATFMALRQKMEDDADTSPTDS